MNFSSHCGGERGDQRWVTGKSALAAVEILGSCR